MMEGISLNHGYSAPGSLRSRLLVTSATIALMAVASGSARAADLPSPAPLPQPPVFTTLPAVSAFNGKFDGGGGTFDGRKFGFSTGAVSAPLGQSFGAQLDAIGGGGEAAGFIGGAGHLFWRDPSKGLLGAYGSLTHFAGDRLFTIGNVPSGGIGARFLGRIAPEVELYFGRFSFEGQAGYQFSDAGRSFNLRRHNFDTRGRGFYSLADVVYYVTDDLRIALGHRFVVNRNAAAAGLEYQLPFDTPFAVTLFAEGRFGEDHYRAAWGGIRIYFGDEKKTLIRRHREDDPRVRLVEEVLSQNRHGTRGAAATAASCCPATAATSASAASACAASCAPPPPPPPPPPPATTSAAATPAAATAAAATAAAASTAATPTAATSTAATAGLKVEVTAPDLSSASAQPPRWSITTITVDRPPNSIG